MHFSSRKCKIVVLNRPERGLTFNLSGDPLEIVPFWKYLGIDICRSGTNSFRKYFEEMLKKAQTRLNCIKHYGYHEDGLNPITALKLYKLLVRPILEYGAQVIDVYRNWSAPSKAKISNISKNHNRDFLKDLEHFQTKALKSLLGFPRHTPPDQVRLATGVESIALRLDLLKLRFFWKIKTDLPGTLSHTIHTHRFATLLQIPKGFHHDVFDLCCKYGAFEIWHGTVREIYNFGPQWDFKVFSKRKLTRYHMFLDYRTAWKSNTIFSQNYLDVAFASKKYHMSRPLFLASKCRNPSSRKALIRAIFHSKSFHKFCPLCSTACTKVVEHQIFHCPKIQNDRDRFLTTLSPGSRQLFNPEDFPTLFKATSFENLGKFLQAVKY